jgi:hypothetical protein
MGWNDVSYSLRIEDYDEGSMFEIAEEMRELGNDIIVSSGDADEVAYWIKNQIEEKEA